MRIGQRVKTKQGVVGTIRYRTHDWIDDKQIWFCVVTPDGWDEKDETLLSIPQDELIAVES